MSKKDNYQVRLLSPGEYRLWEMFVRESPQRTLFHTIFWAEHIKQVFRRDYRIVVLQKKEQIAAGMLFWPKKVLFIDAVTHIPNTTYQGPLFRKPGASKASSLNSEYHKQSGLLLEYLVRNYQLIDIPLSPGISDARPYLWKNFRVETAYTYRFEITEFDSLQQQFSQDLRRKIKKAADQGITFRESGETGPLTRFVLESYRESASSPAISGQLIKSFMELSLKSASGRLYYQYQDMEPVGGIFVLCDEETVYALFSGISADKRDTANNELVHAHVLSQPDFLGRQFDFLGANSSHLEQFKRSFGGELIPYFKVNFKSSKTVSSLFYARSKYHLAKRKFKSFY